MLWNIYVHNDGKLVPLHLAVRTCTYYERESFLSNWVMGCLGVLGFGGYIAVFVEFGPLFRSAAEERKVTETSLVRFFSRRGAWCEGKATNDPSYWSKQRAGGSDDHDDGPGNKIAIVASSLVDS